MPSALNPLANVTLTGTATTVTFSSISQAYRDLMLVATPIAATTGNAARMRFNNDTGSNYSWVQMIGDGTSVTSNNNASTTELVGIQAETARSNTIIHVFDYSATNKHKAVLTRASNPSAIVLATSQRWASTSAVTTINLFMTGGTSFAAGTTFALYGVSA